MKLDAVMFSPQIERVPCLSDNYSWLLHEPSAGVTAVVSNTALLAIAWT